MNIPITSGISTLFVVKDSFFFLFLVVSASRAAPAQNGAASYGYPSPGMMNGYGPPPPAPPAYAYPSPAQQNGFYQGPTPAAGNMGYPYPTAAAGREFSHSVLTVLILLGQSNSKCNFLK